MKAKYGKYTPGDLFSDAWKYGKWVLLTIGVAVIVFALLSIVSYNAQVASNVQDFNLTATAIFK